ncbi:MAG: caspase family protein [Cyclobacteriaceae bacterium]|nr:caspase family protein [Cyclobacteriaceae bacterium]
MTHRSNFLKGCYFLLVFIWFTNLQAQNLETVVQRGHSRAVKSVDFSHDGAFIVSGSEDKTIKIWELSSGREIRTYNGHQSEVNDVLFTPDDKMLISASKDGRIYFWDALTGNIIKNYHQPKENILRLALSPNGYYLAVGSTGENINVYDTRLDSIIYSVKGSRMARDNVFINSIGTKLITGLDNRKVIIYELSTGELLKEYEIVEGFCGGCITQGITTPHDEVIIGGRYVGLKMYENDTELKSFWNEPEENFSALNISQSGDLLVSVDEDSVFVWDVLKGTKKYALDKNQKERSPKYGIDLTHKIIERRSDQFNDANFSPDGRWLVTGDNSNIITLWDAESGKKTSSFYGYLSFPPDDGLGFDPNSYWESYTSGMLALKNDVQLSPDGKYAYRSKIGYEVRKWELATGQIVQRYGGHAKVVIDFALSKNGSKLLTGSGDRTAHLYDANTGKLLNVFKGHRGMIWDVSFSNDETKIVSSSSDGSVRVWDIETAEQLSYIYLSDDRAKITTGYTVKFSPNDLYLIIGDTKGNLERWEIDTEKKVQEFVGHTNVSMDFEFFNNGKQLASVGWDNSVRTWDLASGFQIRKFEAHLDPVHSIAISANNSWMATAGTDRIAILWDINSGKLIRKFVGHKSIISSVQFSPDNKHLITGSIDGITKIWNLESGLEIITHYVIGKNDWLAKNSKGYFSGTDGAQKQVFFVKGNESYSLDQFFDEYYDPSVLNGVLGETSSRNTILEKILKFPPPSIQIDYPEYGLVQKTTGLDVLTKTFNKGGGLKSISIFHNGKLIETREGSLLKRVSKDKSIIQKFKLNLVSGTNVIKVVATNDASIESKPAEILVEYQTPTQETVLYVLAIGINTYKNSSLNLNYAQIDAESFVELIKKESGVLFDKVETHELYDEEANRTNIMGVLDLLSNRINPGDVFYFYYAGHGSMVDDQFYFVPSNSTRLYSKDKLSKEGISAEQLRNKFQKIAALKQLVIIDACQSGGSAELLAQRGSMEEKAMAQLSRSAGIHVLSAAGSEQFATEFKELGHGVFTYALLEALSGKADGAPKDGTVTIYELKSYIDSLVPEYSQKFKGKTQYPYTFSRGQDFPVTIIK